MLSEFSGIPEHKQIERVIYLGTQIKHLVLILTQLPVYSLNTA